MIPDWLMACREEAWHFHARRTDGPSARQRGRPTECVDTSGRPPIIPCRERRHTGASCNSGVSVLPSGAPAGRDRERSQPVSRPARHRRGCCLPVSPGVDGSAHHGLCRMADLAEGRRRLDRLAATACQNFLPLTDPHPMRQAAWGPRGRRHSSRAKKVPALPSSASLRP